MFNYLFKKFKVVLFAWYCIFIVINLLIGLAGIGTGAQNLDVSIFVTGFIFANVGLIQIAFFEEIGDRLVS